MRLAILIAGPQGSGKTTWARALHSLTEPPDLKRTAERFSIFGEEAYQQRWRPIEQPHHTITPLAMVGGGIPLQPGIISRAHGGVLIMDEFLEFPRVVREALREPIENGYIEHARGGVRLRFPADFQLVATTNLCPCGKFDPMRPSYCRMPLWRCQTTCNKLSGPIMDRFDLLILSHQWLGAGERIHLSAVRDTVLRMREFANSRSAYPQDSLPEWLGELPISHRRRRSLLRVARGLADFDNCDTIQPQHFNKAYEKVTVPMHSFNQLFG